MLPTLVSRNDDIRRLVEKGYAVAFDSNYLVVRDIPFLGKDGELNWGAIVTLLSFVDKHKVRQKNHQVSFAGSDPYGLDGRPIPNLAGTPHHIQLSAASADVVVERQFSNKPAKGYVDFCDKIDRYVTIISGPAIALHGVTPLTFREYGDGDDDSVFKFRDTLTTNAEISDLALPFKEEVVAIIGLGGTGSYILDFLVKVPVKEIRAFDADEYHVHNAFRSPGCLLEGELGRSKADVYGARYDNFRNGLSIQAKYIDESCGDDLNGVSFAFVSVDKGSARAEICALLLKKGIPFIDVGMGLNRKRQAISGSLRTTYFSKEGGAKVLSEQLVPTHDNPDDVYKTNIQISELNALNACLAVIAYKKRLGFYVDDEAAYNLLFSVGDMRIVRQPDAV
jgi:hypothetical protein